MQHDRNGVLPPPDVDSARHSERVAEFIGERIAEAGGSIGFGEYMQHAMYAPGLGYYAAGATKFGAAGDFVTAPEVSSLFGRVVARQCAEVLSATGGVIREYGAGSGKLATDVLQALLDFGALPERYEIVEVSPELQRRQEAQVARDLPDLLPIVSWLAEPSSRHRGVVLANEVLDALPVERFVRRKDGVMQQRVTSDGGRLVIIERSAPPRLAKAVADIECSLGAPLPEGYTSEVSLGIGDWIAGLAAALELGVAFLFDYGLPRREYYAAERGDGWLRCHFRHHAHNDPLILPGIQDLTSWVDFTAVAEAAVASGCDVAGFSAQAQFLLAGGLAEEMNCFASLPLERQLALSQQIKTLTLPGEMGEHFKCIALRRGDIATPSAFGVADRTHTL
jgi:SAM-dependent MidA family methyltransferase